MPGAILLAGQLTQQSWQGPYPPPEAAERFEALLPGTFNRIITMAEKAQAAQIAAVNNAHEFARRDTRRGHILGFSSTVIAMVFAIICVYLKNNLIVALFLGVPVLAVGKALVESVHRLLAVTTVPLVSQGSTPTAGKPSVPQQQGGSLRH